MYRCLLAAAFVVAAAPSWAQAARPFPQNALRGTITFGAPPVIALNGDATRLAPGARVRGQDNMLVMTGPLVDKKAIVHYTVEPSSGLVNNVWILTEAEIRNRPWPVNAAQTAAWTFDPAAQRWVKP